MNDIVQIIDKCSITKESISGVAQRLNYDVLSTPIEQTSEEVASSFIRFYDDAIIKGFNKNVVSRLIIKIMEDGIKNSLKFALKDFQPPAVEVPKKKNAEFIYYLNYASDKWGTEEEKNVVKKLVEKIK